MKKRVLSALLLLCMSATMATGCGGCNKEQVPTEATEAPVVETETATEESREGMLKSPLTGLWVDEKVAKTRPVAIMTENTDACLPQYGMNKSDIIYEAPIEGTITRCMQIFQDYSSLEKMGNVRSCRPYFYYFAVDYDALYIHAGKSDTAKKALDSDLTDHVDGSTSDGKYFYRDSTEHEAPHNYFISAESIQKIYEDKQYRSTVKEDYGSHFLFANEDEPVNLENGIPANVVKLYFYYNRPYFVYNEEDGLYYRYQFKEKQVDGIDGSQVTVKNIIIQNMDSEIVDEEYHLRLSSVGEGTGYYITNGKCIEITWKREAKESSTHYYDLEGKEIVLNPGRTWIAGSENENASGNKFFESLEAYEEYLKK